MCQAFLRDYDSAMPQCYLQLHICPLQILRERKYPFYDSLFVKFKLSEERGMYFQCVLSRCYRIVLDNLFIYHRW